MKDELQRITEEIFQLKTKYEMIHKLFKKMFSDIEKKIEELDLAIRNKRQY